MIIATISKRSAKKVMKKFCIDMMVIGIIKHVNFSNQNMYKKEIIERTLQCLNDIAEEFVIIFRVENTCGILKYNVVSDVIY